MDRLNILFLAGRESSYTRNQVLINAFNNLGDVTVAAQHYAGRSIILRSVFSALEYHRSRSYQKYDLIVVGFYGNIIARLIGKSHKIPRLFDAFVSTYDTLVNDRQVYSPSSPGARIAFWLDAQAYARVDHILCDTQANVHYLIDHYSLSPAILDRLYVGCDEMLFKPSKQFGQKETTQVLFYGTYLPLHGVDVIVKAAAILKEHQDIHLVILGDGKGRPEIQKMAETRQLENITFLPAVPLANLPAIISQADICLGGPFGPGVKADRVIAGKTFQMLAMAKPVIVSRNTANPELLTDHKDALFCNRDDPQDLAQAILRLAVDPELRKRLGENGYLTYKRKASQAIIQAQLREIMARMGF